MSTTTPAKASDNPGVRTGKAILFVHGINGSPDFFWMLEKAVPPGWTLNKVCHAGHCSTLDDFANASMRNWKEQVRATVIMMRARYRTFVIVGHSMGTLFAIRHAVEGNADGIFLINPPLSLHMTKRMFTTPFKIYLDYIPQDDMRTKAAVNAYSAKVEHNPMKYIRCAPRFIELFIEIISMRRITRKLTIPARAYMSENDEMVAKSGCRFFAGQQNTRVTVLPNSSHYYYPDPDRGILVHDLLELLAQVTRE